jgi:hypothetical protein
MFYMARVAVGCKKARQKSKRAHLVVRPFITLDRAI